MNIGSLSNLHSSVYTLEEILKDIPETAAAELADIEETYQSYKEKLNQELIITDRLELEFHAGQCEQYGHAAKSILYRIVNSSIGCPENSIAAVNAITILKVMKVSFSCLDLAGIQIPGADLSGAILDGADASGANLENVNLRNASLNYTNMSKANLKNVKFDLPDVFIHEHAYRAVSYSIGVSPDNKHLVSEDEECMYFWHLPSKILIDKLSKQKSNDERFYSSHDEYKDFCDEKIFTPDGQFLFTYDINQDLDIWRIDSHLIKLGIGRRAHVKHIKKLEVYNKKITSPGQRTSYRRSPILALSPNGTQLITYSKSSLNVNEKAHVKLWELQKKENHLLDINLKKEVFLSDCVYRICFSKKFPVFYCLERKYLYMYNLDKFLTMTKVNKLDNPFVGVPISTWEKNTYLSDANAFSLAIWDTEKNNEELLFIAIDTSIYSVNILKMNEQNWPLTPAPVKKIRTEIDAIFDMKLLTKTSELIYACNDAICLYSIKNNQLIGKFRLFDTDLKQFSVSSDEASIYIISSSRVYTFSIETLKNSTYISYQMDNDAACFSADMRSIISFSSSYYVTVYDVETGATLISKPFISNESYCEISFSHNTQHIFIREFGSSHYLKIINTETKELFFEIPKGIQELVLSSSSEYLALQLPRTRTDGHYMIGHYMIEIYKTIPSKQCIGSFRIMDEDATRIDESATLMAIAKDFRNTPKIVLSISNDHHNNGRYVNKVVIYNFVFKNEVVVELLSRKEFPQKSSGVQQIQFIENDSKLIIVFDYSKIVIWDIEHDQYEEYNIKASEVDISRDGAFLIYCGDYEICLWSITQKKLLITQILPLPLTKVQISPDNRYIIGTSQNNSMYVWKIFENSFRLLWRTSHSLHAKGLILDDNNLEKDIEEELIEEMDAIKL